MRLLVRLSSDSLIRSDFQGPSTQHQILRKTKYSCSSRTPSPHKAIPGPYEPLIRKDNSSWEGDRQI